MKSFVLDTSVVFGFFFEDEMTDYTEAILNMLPTHHIITSSLFPLEVNNVLYFCEQKKRWSLPDIRTFERLLKKLPIVIEKSLAISDIRSLMKISKQYTITSYDASYLSLALQYNIPLATQDKALQQAAKKAGVFLTI